tara:strand:+ start:60 stop:353 length:294 start_codon:yes stop_codon:yes gene_type:complete
MGLMTLGEVARDAVEHTAGLRPHPRYQWADVLEPEQIQGMLRETVHEFLYLSCLTSERDFDGTYEAHRRAVYEAIKTANRVADAIELLRSLGYQVSL